MIILASSIPDGEAQFFANVSFELIYNICRGSELYWEESGIMKRAASTLSLILGNLQIFGFTKIKNCILLFADEDDELCLTATELTDPN